MPRVRLEDTRDWQLADRSHDVRGRELRDSVGRALGTIKTMIVDTDARRVESVVLEDGTEYPVRDLQIMEQAVYFIPSMPGAAPEPPAPAPSIATDEPPVFETEPVEEPAMDAAPEAPTWQEPEQPANAQAGWTPRSGAGGWSPPSAESAPMPPAM